MKTVISVTETRWRGSISLPGEAQRQAPACACTGAPLAGWATG
ncbi:hypothetical protein [Nissabacter archeti]|nr:hypothetical protein [Nissabacter archeti]